MNSMKYPPWMIYSNKILCKDISEEPSFWLDEEGAIIPRHSVYYIVPKNPSILHQLYEYLNSEEVGRWLIAHAQRAANDFIRLQSSVLKKIPIPVELLKHNKILNYTTPSST